MSSRILAVAATLALGIGAGGLAYATARGEAAPSTVTPSASTAPDPCGDPASTDPACVTVVQVPTAVAPAAGRTPAPARVSDQRRRDRGSDTDRSGHGHDDHDDHDDRDDNDDADRDHDRDESGDSGRDGGGDDGTPDQGSGDR